MTTSIQQQLNTAFAKHQSGDIDGAVALYQEILKKESQPDALHMLGVAAQQKGNSELALKLIEAALAQNHSLPLAAHNRSIVLRALGRVEEAMQSSQQATTHDPAHAEAWKIRGILARDLGDAIQACAYHRHAVGIQPQDLGLQIEYALSLYANGDLRNAYKIMRDITDKDHSLVPLTLANTLKSAGYPERAIPIFRRSREMMPQNRELYVNEATALLQTGNLEQGFALWENRPDIDPHFHSIPLWDGRPVDHLLLHEDQGIGDSLQFIRYTPFLRGKAARITLQIAPILQKLFAASLPGIEIITSDQPVRRANARARLASLPFFARTKIDTIPAPVPYMQAHEEWRAPWRERLAGVRKPRVGLIWGGNPANHNDRNRSIAFSQLTPILQTGGAHLVSLQKGAQKTQADLAAFTIFDADPYLDDFSATAGLLAELDLVITVCTAPVHLAGAMGRPGWLMLCFDPHWVWMLGREDSPWYPHLRLFRQPAPGDWASVVVKVADELRKFLVGDTGVLKPQPWSGPPLQQNPFAIDLTDT